MRHRDASGQAIIEACFAIVGVSLIFFGLLQVAQLLGAREILDHAAARGARARTVGLNRWMVSKVVDVAAIPNCGRMTAPEYENINPWLRDLVANFTPGDIWDRALHAVPISRESEIERARIPDYLGAENQPRARFILNYADWDSLSHWSGNGGGIPGGDSEDTLIRFHVGQDYRLWVPMHQAFYADDEVALAADAYIEGHYPLYLTELNW